MRILSFLLFLAACADPSRVPADKPASADKGDFNDDDGDGASEAAGDCDDADASRYPGALELCDGIDNDCDCTGDTNEDGIVCSTYDDNVDDLDAVHVDAYTFALDADGDGFNDDYGSVKACNIYVYVDFIAANYGDLRVEDYEKLTDEDYYDEDGDGDPSEWHKDCDDDNVWVYPGAPEVCDGQPNDCDAWDTWDATSEEGLYTTFYVDNDYDTYGSDSSTVLACEAFPGWVDNVDDCNDEDGTIYPGAPESCNGVDDNCDESVDEGVMSSFYADVDGDGQGNASSSTEGCEAPGGFVDNILDCNDGDASTYTGAPETCSNDTVDNDCDGATDDTPVDRITRYDDFDGDTYGDPADSFTSCIAPDGYVDNGDDCDDNDDTIHPGAGDDGSDGVDNDCDGEVDEDPCAFVITTLADEGDVEAIDFTSTDVPSYDGELYPSGVVGFTVTITALDSSARQIVAEADLCMSDSGSAFYDVDFANGTSLGDDAAQNTTVSTDGVENHTALYDPDGDGNYGYLITP